VDIEGVSPFHRALNEAARRMTSPFFVQVDADMILDRDCFAELRGAVRSDTGIVVGELRDPMAGHTVGVKLFRKACFADAQASDSVSPDTDFGRAIRRRGWKTVYASRPAGAFQATRTFGEHRPDYTPPYTWRKFLLEGGRLRYRGAQGGLRSRIARLESSRHPQARLALLALYRGFFRAGDHDGLVPMDESADAAPSVQLLESCGRADEPVAELVSSIAEVVNRDPRVGEAMKVVFVPDYNVSVAETIIPAADVSEQISTAGTEASGTGNMKFAMNGALTVGTLDGANIEIREEVGDENIYIFGLTAGEIEGMQRQGSYAPRARYEASAVIRRVLDALASDLFSPRQPGLFRPLCDRILRDGDPYFHLADLEAYIATHDRVSEDFLDRSGWARKTILNVARMGRFSSDRTVLAYATEIWGIRPEKGG